MATITVRVPPVFTVGQTLKVYVDRVGDVVPQGTPLQTVVVGADSTVTISGLDANRPYVVGTEVGGQWRGFLVEAAADVPTTQAETIADLVAHEAAATNVHGIANTALLVPMPRRTTRLTTASLAAAAQETGTVLLSRSVRVVAVTVDRKARIRLYASAAARDATGEAARAITSLPADGAGVILDVEVDSAVNGGQLILGPQALGSNFNAGADPTLYYRVDNTSGGTGVVNVDFDYQALEG